MRRVATEWEISPNDRIPMMDLAVAIMQSMNQRDPSKHVEEQEEAAYNAALAYLAREFNRGPVAATSHMVKSEDIQGGDGEC